MLTRKLGGLPVWAWGLIAVAGLAAGIYLKRRSTNASGALATGSTPSVDNTGTTSYPDFSGATAGGSSGGGTPAPAQGIDPAQYVNDVLSSFQGGAANALANFQNGVSLGQQFPITSGGNGAGVSPSSQVPAPAQVPAGVASTPHSTATSIGKAAPSPIRYYTYKKNVPLATGQTLHYTKGKGYYAA